MSQRRKSRRSSHTPDPKGRIACMEWWWESCRSGHPKKAVVFPRWFIIADDLGLRELAQHIQRLRRKVRKSLGETVYPDAGFETEVGLFDACRNQRTTGVRGQRIRLTIVGYSPRQLAAVKRKFVRANPDDTAAHIWGGILKEVRRQQKVLRKCRSEPTKRSNPMRARRKA